MKEKVIALLIISLTFFYGVGFAQDLTETKKIEFGLSGDLVSRYVWRGSQFGGNSANIQPSVTLTKGKFEVGIWGAYSLGGFNPSQEFDYYLSYSFANDMVSVLFTDYFFPAEGNDFKYFDYSDNTTGHVLEGTIKFNGTEKIPFSILAAINFFGADAISLNDDPTSSDFNTKSGIQYSTYIELGYDTKIKGLDFNAFIGSSLNSVKETDNSTGFVGETGYYGKRAGIVNLGFKGSKSIQITNNFSLPISGSVIVNPMSEKVFFVFGIFL